MSEEILSAEDVRFNKLIPRLFVVFFMVIVAVNGVFLFFAQTTHTGVVRDDAYQVGLDYNEVISKADAIERLGWQAALSVEGDVLNIELTDQNGDPITGANVKAALKRPVVDGFDFEARLTDIGSGRYRWNGAGVWPARGQWDAILDVRWQQHSFQMKQRIILE